MVHPSDPTELPQHRWTRERLSAYVDNDLPPGERDQVEAHLSACESCARETDTLRQTVSLLRQLPSRPVPRSFVLSLSPTRSARGQLAWLFPYLSAAGALAAILLIVVLTADWLQVSGTVRLAAAPTSRLTGIGAAPPLGNVLRLPGSNAAPQAEPATPQAMRPEPRGRLDQAAGAAAALTAESGQPTSSQDKIEAQAEETAKTAASTPSSQLAASLPTVEAPAALGSPPPSAGAGAALVAPLARKPSQGVEGGQAQDESRPAAAPPRLAPAAPQVAAPTGPASPLEFAAPAPLTATPVVTPTASRRLAEAIAPTAAPILSPALSAKSVLPAVTPTMTATTPTSSTIIAAVLPAPTGAAPIRSPGRWVWRILEVGLVLAAAVSLTGAWWVRRRR
jgi:hypothetical protein